MKFLKNILSTLQSPENQREPVLGEIASQLTSISEDKAEKLAIFAFILARVAYADQNIDESELRQMEEIVESKFNLTKKEAHLVVELVSHRNQIQGGTENYVVTKEFYENSSDQERLQLLDALFAVAAADDSIISSEEKELKLIASELKISDANFVLIRGNYRDKREVFKNSPSSQK